MAERGTGSRVLDGLRFAANPLAYLLSSGGRMPTALGGGNVLNAARPVINTVSGWFQPTYRGPMSANSRGSWAPPSGGSGGYSPFNPAYSQAARANSPVGRSMQSNRDTFRELNPTVTYVGAAHRNGNNGRLLGGGVLGSVWRQGGITFNDRQQTL